MTRRATAKDLEFIVKLEKNKLGFLSAGESLTQRTGYTIRELQEKATKDRLELSSAHLIDAKSALKSLMPAYRMSISRSYYSMYHAGRAVSFCANSGDDYQDHSKLPSGIPKDFPNRDIWENALKNARLERNRADYEPYPRNDAHFSDTANEQIQLAMEFLKLVKSYLHARGWQI